MNYILAVSGGVDSVVLLDMFSRTKHHLIVAHVEHGIRGDDSKADARFVRELAKKYKLPLVSAELNLGSEASEEQARIARYDFLLSQVKEHKAQLVTAHHQDDLVETIAININRGTGWRGLAVLSRHDVHRPLLGLSKSQIYDYALKNKLEYVEDATNLQDTYLRNRIRKLLAQTEIDNYALSQLRAKQLQLKSDIDKEANKILLKSAGSRYFMKMIPDDIAVELLGAEIAKLTTRPTRPRLLRALHSIKVAKPDSVFQLGDNITISFSVRNYEITVV